MKISRLDFLTYTCYAICFAYIFLGLATMPDFGETPQYTPAQKLAVVISALATCASLLFILKESHRQNDEAKR